MKKFLSAIVAMLLSCMLLVAFAGCADNISSITDIERFADMQQQADKIDVDFENGRQYGFQFTITDEGEIEEIMNIIFSNTLSKYADGELQPPGYNTVIKIYQGEKSYTLNVSFISANGKLYSFTTSKLADKITELATAAGAFESLDDLPYNATFFDSAVEWIKEEFQNENPIKTVGFVGEDNGDDPLTRTFVVTDSNYFESIFVDNFSGFEVDFDNEMVVVYTFGTEYVLPATITNMTLTNATLTINYQIQLIPGAGSAVRPFQRWFVVKLDKMDISSVQFEEN